MALHSTSGVTSRTWIVGCEPDRQQMGNGIQRSGGRNGSRLCRNATEVICGGDGFWEQRCRLLSFRANPSVPDRCDPISRTITATVPMDRIPCIKEAPTLLLWVADASRSAAITRTQGSETVILEQLDAFLMAAQNAALAAESIGLGVVFLGVLRNAAREVAEIVGLPPDAFFTFGMAARRPAPDRVSAPRPRLPQSVMLHMNRYDDAANGPALEGYEEAYSHFRESQACVPRAGRMPCMNLPSAWTILAVVNGCIRW